VANTNRARKPIFWVKFTRHIICDDNILENTANRVTKLFESSKMGMSARTPLVVMAVNISAINTETVLMATADDIKILRSVCNFLSFGIMVSSMKQFRHA
jgi:hypothetical protein